MFQVAPYKDCYTNHDDLLSNGHYFWLPLPVSLSENYTIIGYLTLSMVKFDTGDLVNTFTQMDIIKPGGAIVSSLIKSKCLTLCEFRIH